MASGGSSALTSAPRPGGSHRPRRGEMNGAMRRWVWLAAMALILGIPGLTRAQARAIATVETNMKATGEIYECKRKQGVLTIKVRFKATSGRAELDLPYETTYVVDVASGKKYAILRDSDKAPLAPTSQGAGDRMRQNRW